MTDLTSFHLFPQLSNEIRDIIWRHTLKPRYVKITARSRYQGHMDEEYCLPDSAQTYSNFCFQSLGWPRSALPVALQVHRASRTGILPLYPLMFEGSFHKPPKSANERQRQLTRARLNAMMSPARFNPQLDTLVLLNYPTLLLAGTFFSSEMALVRRLVVFLGNAQRDVLPTALAAFEKLEGITWFLNKRQEFSTYLSLPSLVSAPVTQSTKNFQGIASRTESIEANVLGRKQPPTEVFRTKHPRESAASAISKWLSDRQ